MAACLRRAGRGALATILLCGAHVARAASATTPDLTELALEELANLEVTTVSKKPEALAGAPAAIHVITQEDMRRAGVTTLAEALRLAPGVQVARINANQWAIGVRGFASRLADSVLVLIDGRSVYTPLFAGTYWEVQDTLLEDVDRIEVIRGPGGTLWGPNAFNGVINVITKSARETQGGLLGVGAGTEERGFAGVRYGAGAGEGAAWRAYLKGFDRDAAYHADGADYDAGRAVRAGFRVDAERGAADQWTLQGDAYTGEVGQRVAVSSYDAPFTVVVDGDAEVSGGNLLGRFVRDRQAGVQTELQVYYDRTSRAEANFEEDRDTFDVDFRQRRNGDGPHDLVWGLDGRLSRGATTSVATVVFTPTARTDRIVEGFVQDELTLSGRLRLIGGTKVTYNGYSGLELQPSLRLAATTGRSSWWLAASRAVRTPSRVERDLQLTVAFGAPGSFARVLGSPGFDAESVLAFEAGWRSLVGSKVLLDAAAFYNDYDDLMSLELGTPFQESEPPPEHQVVPFTMANGLAGHSHGFELAPTVALRPWWQLSAAYAFLRIELAPEPGSTDATSEAAEDASPRHQALLRSSMDLGERTELDLVLRWVDALEGPQVPSYTSLDARLAWRARPGLELALVGQDLLERRHAEFGAAAGRVLIERGVYGKVTWRW